MEHIGGEKHYKAPPLRKGEILASVSGLLANNELLRMPLTRELDRYTNGDLGLGEEEEDDDDEYESSTARPRVNPYADEKGHLIPERLANSHGLHATENLIEALFNPVPSTSPLQTPFTYYVPRETEKIEERDGGADASSDSLTNGSGAERQSIASSRRSTGDSFASNSAASVYTSASGSDHSSVNGLEAVSQVKSNRHWWQKLRSHPNHSNTHVTRRFQAPTPFSPPELVVSHRDS